MTFRELLIGQRFYYFNKVSGKMLKSCPAYEKTPLGEFKKGQPYNATYRYKDSGEMRTGYVFILADEPVQAAD